MTMDGRDDHLWSSGDDKNCFSPVPHGSLERFELWWQTNRKSFSLIHDGGGDINVVANPQDPLISITGMNTSKHASRRLLKYFGNFNFPSVRKWVQKQHPPTHSLLWLSRLAQKLNKERFYACTKNCTRRYYRTKRTAATLEVFISVLTIDLYIEQEATITSLRINTVNYKAIWRRATQALNVDANRQLYSTYFSKKLLKSKSPNDLVG